MITDELRLCLFETNLTSLEFPRSKNEPETHIKYVYRGKDRWAIQR